MIPKKIFFTCWTILLFALYLGDTFHSTLTMAIVAMIALIYCLIVENELNQSHERSGVVFMARHYEKEAEARKEALRKNELSEVVKIISMTPETKEAYRQFVIDRRARSSSLLRTEHEEVSDISWPEPAQQISNAKLIRSADR